MLIPFTVDVPMNRWPYANWVLIAVTVVVSIVDWVNAPKLNLSLNVMQQDMTKLTKQDYDRLKRELKEAEAPTPMALSRSAFKFVQFFSYVLVHGDIWHLLGNMVFLFCFGNAINAKLGHIAFVLLYFLLGAVAGATWLWLGAGEALIGASGAIMGITGMMFVLYPRNEIQVLYYFGFAYSGVTEIMSFWLILLYMGFDLIGILTAGESGIAYVCHLGGEAFGILIAIVLLLTGLVKSEHYEENLLQMIGWQQRTVRKKRRRRSAEE